MTTSGEALVQVEFRGPAAWVTLNRPDRLNALTPDAVAQLESAVDEITHHPEVRAVALTGAGRGFCAGVDLSFARDAVAGGYLPAFLSELQRVFLRLEQLPMPVVAVVNGVAVGGGLELILCCDLVLAATGAKLGDGHATYGLLPGGGASFRLPRRIGFGHAAWLLLTGELLPSERLRDLGLVHECAAPAELPGRATDLLTALAGASPLALRETKRLLRDAAAHPGADPGAAEVAAFTRYLHSRDITEGLDAFLQRRTPRFEGR